MTLRGAGVRSDEPAPRFRSFFSPDYASARARFLEACAAAGAEHEALALDARGPGGEPLATDLAWVGPRAPATVLLVASGLHGVEAFAGSAIQLAALASAARPPSGCALVLAHVLNPYGMAWLRRANENNVDLNRNFLLPGELYRGAPELYARLDPLLNPPSPPRRDAFLARALFALARYGPAALRQAIAGGQYEYPRGLFYGGGRLEQGPRLFLEWAKARLGGVSRLLLLDLHTGLGRRGRVLLIRDPGAAATPRHVLERALRRPVLDPAGERSLAYRARGALAPALAAAIPAARVDGLVVEFGTAPPLAVLHALREENRWHHFGDGSLAHPAKEALREALCPASPRWRRRVVEQGLELLRAAAAWLFERKGACEQ